MQTHWAEIRLDQKPCAITFHTEPALGARNLLDNVLQMRVEFRKHKKPVLLTSSDVATLQSAGVTVLSRSLLALDDIWHWFTGALKHDAFALSSDFELRLVKEGSIRLELPFASDPTQGARF